MIFLTLICSVFFYFAHVFYSKWKIFHYMVSNFPSPPRHPITGNISLFSSSSIECFKTNLELIRTYGKHLVLTWPIFDVILVTSDPKEIETLLVNSNTKRAKKSFFYKQLEPWLGTGLLTAYGEKWFARRKIITPSFHFNILNEFLEVMCRQSDVFVRHLKSKVGAGDVDISKIIYAFALDVICETSMGVIVNAQSAPDSEYITSVKKISAALLKRSFHPSYKFPFFYNLTADGKYLKYLTKVLHDFTNKVIVERREKILKKDLPIEKRAMNFLDSLLHATIDGNPLSNTDIREEVDTFMFGGHDTTASSIGFTLYLLARHPDIQEKLYQELTEIFESKDQMKVTHTKLNQLTYLNRVIKESLRIFPSAPTIERELMEETIIGGIKVPAGITISLSIFAIHHDPENFPDPEKFDPERFNTNNLDKTKSCYIPFSAGGRNCIGQKFALLKLKTVISKIIMNYRLLPSHDIILQNDIILKSSNGVYVKLEDR